MTKRILVPIDGSSQSDDALEHALKEFGDHDLTVLHVIDPVDTGYSGPVGIPGGSEEWYEKAKQESEELFEDAQAVADEYGVTLDTAAEPGRPARTIVEYADDEGFDQIVMGSHGRSGVSRILLGSVAETVVRRATMPVTVVR
ncbi:universal stress protein [Halorussus sp. MSC15.2]|uniref:universal stress protein n=1 Tax=Halorussus sp. MSC15.2 TaxID=2283638 RepID=UPI0013CFCC7D|nr:universal stress protein [Halorussus sp. MSC15.2]NEU55839.1 universal stress protein [Halorussus sp. MSC15.2]